MEIKTWSFFVTSQLRFLSFWVQTKWHNEKFIKVLTTRSALLSGSLVQNEFLLNFVFVAICLVITISTFEIIIESERRINAIRSKMVQ